MPRLLVLTQTHNLWGGIEAWMSHLFPGLRELGWDIHYGLAQGARFNKPKEFRRTHPYIREFTILDGRVGTPFSRRQAILKAINRVCPDIVIPLAIGDTSSAVRDYRSQGKAIRLVHVLHSTHLGTMADQIENADVVDGIGSVGGLLYQWTMKKFAGTPIRLAHLRNGVPSPITVKREPINSILHVGYVGRLDQNSKRVLDIIPILERVCAGGIPVRFTLVGDGPTTRQLNDGLSQLPLNRYEFLGFQSPRDLYRKVYPTLHCLLLCSDKEGSPLVLMEAMRHGVVPVTSRFLGHAAEGLLRPRENCLTFPVGDYDAAAYILIHDLAQEQTRQQLSENAIRTSSGYDVSFMLRSWHRFLSEILGQENRSGLKLDKQLVLPGHSFGRLDHMGIPPTLTNWMRYFAKKRYPHPTGFDEWPGSLSCNRELKAIIAGDLESIEEQTQQGLYAGSYSNY